MSRKTRDFEVAHRENFVILACTVLIQITSVTDGQADGRTPSAKHSAIARNHLANETAKLTPETTNPQQYDRLKNVFAFALRKLLHSKNADIGKQGCKVKMQYHITSK